MAARRMLGLGDNPNSLYQSFNTEERLQAIIRDQVQNARCNVYGTMRTEEFNLLDVCHAKITSVESYLHGKLDRNHIELIAKSVV